jgi:uncharacterized membrane protein YhaH (DUF805 family)
MNWYLLVLKKYADFNGRARRKEYWYFTLFSILISFGLIVIETQMEVKYIDTFYSLAVLVPSFAVAIRRMHDVGKSGWYVLIPIYNLILACTEGTEGTNEYGPDPKRPELEDDIELIGRN